MGRKVNQVVFPVSYHDKFYKDVLGAVCCRVDTANTGKKLYIMTLGCLAPYRRLGIGTKMLEHVLNVVETKEQYYKRIEPADAHVLEKYLKPEELNTKLSNGFGDVGQREN